MRAEEIRIGNWVYDDMNDMVKIDHPDIGEQLYIFYNPIPLTEEILLKCGFEYRFHQYTYKELSIKLSEEHFLVFNMKNGNIYTTNNEEWELHSGVYLYDINYLHQLQNLIYALTNQELNIKL